MCVSALLSRGSAQAPRNMDEACTNGLQAKSNVEVSMDSCDLLSFVGQSFVVWQVQGYVSQCKCMSNVSVCKRVPATLFN